MRSSRIRGSPVNAQLMLSIASCLQLHACDCFIEGVTGKLIPHPNLTLLTLFYFLRVFM